MFCWYYLKKHKDKLRAVDTKPKKFNSANEKYIMLTSLRDWKTQCHDHRTCGNQRNTIYCIEIYGQKWSSWKNWDQKAISSSSNQGYATQPYLQSQINLIQQMKNWKTSRSAIITEVAKSRVHLQLYRDVYPEVVFREIFGPKIHTFNMETRLCNATMHANLGTGVQTNGSRRSGQRSQKSENIWQFVDWMAEKCYNNGWLQTTVKHDGGSFH